MVGYEKRIGDAKVTIGVTELPNRKRLYLFIQKGSVIYPYASFNKVEHAYKFMDMFADFIGAERIEWFGRDTE